MKYLVDDYTNSLVSNIRQKIRDFQEYVNRLKQSHSLLVVQEKLRFQYAQLNSLSHSLRNSVIQTVMDKKAIVNIASGLLINKNPANKININYQYLEQTKERMQTRYERFVDCKSVQLAHVNHQLDKRNPIEPLERGFTRILQNGSWIRSKNHFQKGTNTLIEWKDGTEEFNS